MKKNKQINKKLRIFPLNNSTKSMVFSSLLEAVTQSLGYNPNVNYSISTNFKHCNLPTIPSNLLETQNKPIFISNYTRNELLSCKKYIYKIDVKRITHKNTNKGNHDQFIYYLIGKTSVGYIPFVLILSVSNTNIKSSFYAVMKGKDFFALKRNDNQAMSHYNHYFNAKRPVFEPMPKNRLVYKAHSHFYDENVMLFIYNNLLKLQKNSKNALNCKVLKECDAITLTDSPNNFQKMMEACVGNTSTSCMLGFNENASLSEIYNYCFKKEQELFSLKGLNKLDAFGKHSIKNIYTKNNLNDIEPNYYTVIEK